MKLTHYRSILLVALLISASLSVSQKTIKAPVRRVKPGQRTESSLGRMLREAGNLTANSIELPMYNYMDLQYTTTIGLGNQGDFTVLLDTGSGILWVPKKGLSDFNKQFDCNSSPTCTDTFTRDSINYAKGEVDGDIVTENVHFDNKTLEDQKILVIDTDADFGQVTFDGLMGVGPSQDTNFPNLIVTNMKNAGIIDQASFSLYLGAPDDSADSEDSGVIVFGGHDSAYFPDNNTFTYVDVDTSKYWGVHLGGIDVGSHSLSISSSMHLVPDSGTSLALVDQNLLSTMVDKMTDKSCSMTYQGLYSCSCGGISDFPTLTFFLDKGLNVTLEPSDYIIGGWGSCTLKFQAITGLPDYFILGDIFMRNYYIDFNADTQKIGFSGRYHYPDASWKKYTWIIVGTGVILIVAIAICCCVIKKGKAAAKNKAIQRPLNYGGYQGGQGQNSGQELRNMQGSYQPNTYGMYNPNYPQNNNNPGNVVNPWANYQQQPVGQPQNLSGQGGLVQGFQQEGSNDPGSQSAEL